MRKTALLPVVLLICVGCSTSRPSVRQSFREGSGRTIVMLGGGVYGAAMFAPHARELSNEFDVIRVQTLNVQLADSEESLPYGYSVASEAAALRDTLESLGVTGPVDLVGSSFGAVVALHFAVSHPGRVRSLVLFEPPVFWVFSDDEFADDPVLDEMRTLTSKMTPWATPSDQDLVRFRCLLGACPAIPRGSDRAEWDRSRRAMRGLAAVPSHHEDAGRVAQLHQPVLLLEGSETVSFHRRMNERLARMLPRAETAELPGGHGALRTAVPELVAYIRNFVRRQD